jgi:hypothetical protein
MRLSSMDSCLQDLRFSLRLRATRVNPLTALRSE